jgi:predicted RNA polymerase sigma factor
MVDEDFYLIDESVVLILFTNGKLSNTGKEPAMARLQTATLRLTTHEANFLCFATGSQSPPEMGLAALMAFRKSVLVLFAQ